MLSSQSERPEPQESHRTREGFEARSRSGYEKGTTLIAVVLNFDFAVNHMSSMNRYVRFLAVLIVSSIAISIGTGWPLGFVALALFVGWPVVGTLVTIDDDLPGGWSNPDGKVTPEWKTLKWNLEILLCRGSIVVLAFAFQFRSDIALSGFLLIVAAAMGVIGFRYISRTLLEQDCSHHESAR